MTPYIDDLLSGRKQFGVFPDASAEKLIGIFCAGYRVRVSRTKTRLKPDVERLEGYDEVWALCARAPRPGWRLLGRFYDKNVFVALTAWDKNDLFGKYDAAAHEVIDMWKEMFGDLSPFSAGLVEEYLGDLADDIDKPKI